MEKQANRVAVQRTGPRGLFVLSAAAAAVVLTIILGRDLIDDFACISRAFFAMATRTYLTFRAVKGLPVKCEGAPNTLTDCNILLRPPPPF